jgi:Zn-dependent protease with chaperone function
MATIQNFYPAGPANVSLSITEPSASFKSEVKKVMGSITLFFIVYILLIVFSIALAVGCIVVGIAVIAGLASLIGLMLGLGIISIGIMVFVFLIKFIFSVKKFDEAGSIQVTEAEQPHLFDFIRQLTVDTQTQFPKKIILSPEVNACVFYNDSFWSMFFPVKKNLQIGLGLVNTLTLSEFKAVMAHEFGHFSQRSMKLGTFVYNVNKAIYNMLYENKDYGRFLERWGSVHWGIGIFMWVTIQIVKGIQHILQSMYGFINKNYMGLSREMEFHADAVAASVSGSDNLIYALRKAEISDFCYTSVLQKANESIEEKVVFENIYTKHHIVMERYAKDNDLVLENNVPVADDAFFKRFQLSRVNIANQWASHPSREDRENHLLQLNVAAKEDNQQAWVLFNNPLQLQRQLTNVVYRNVPADIKQKTINEEGFRDKFLADINTYSLPAEYNGYYDNRVINGMEIEKVLTNTYSGETSNDELKKLVSDEKVALPKLVEANRNDTLILEKIIKKEIDTKTFDFDGEKFSKEAAPPILEQLNKEVTEQQAFIQQNDENIVTFFYAAAVKKGPEEASALRKLYIEYFDNRKLQDKHFQVCQRIVNILIPLIQGQTVGIEQANQMAAGLRGESQSLKEVLQLWMQKNAFENNTTLKEKADQFLQSQYQYFSEKSFFNNELEDIHYMVNNGLEEVNSFQFRNFKKILQLQLGFL